MCFKRSSAVGAEKRIVLESTETRRKIRSERPENRLCYFLKCCRNFLFSKKEKIARIEGSLREGAVAEGDGRRVRDFRFFAVFPSRVLLPSRSRVTPSSRRKAYGNVTALPQKGKCADFCF
ncbi:MAG: hypothetical protein EGP89_00165 [Ruminococcaceae bacterium]|nr:hypothetical protein [Oscillospiraceae bacterium]